MANDFEKFGGWLLVLGLFYVWKVIEYGVSIVCIALKPTESFAPIWYCIMTVLALVGVGVILMNIRERRADEPNKIIRYSTFILGITFIIIILSPKYPPSGRFFLVYLPKSYLLLTYLVIIPYLKYSRRVKTYYGLNAG